MARNEAPRGRGEPVSGRSVRHGTGVRSNRAFPSEAYPDHLDPFVLFERFYIDPETGFPMHAHEGFEIVTYMIDGGMEHGDSLGVEHVAREGEAMRITAGAGIRHSEFPADGAACNGLQLWVNLSRSEKDADPDYEDASAADLPTAERDGATVTTVVGDGSPLELRTEMEYLDVRVTDAWTWSMPEGWSGFLYGVAGEGSVDGGAFAVGDVLPVTDARDVAVEADGELRLVAVAGRPHGEPIRQRGPVVL
ncbi:pirin-like protein YhhW, possibly qercetin 2,3-dioxygenase activity [Halarchaeum acidiphilum MH1-52-1]|uniref:Pirin-like protein YhhW, possibly qercetin 2,3-dioxygenase activity n=1 Tax=Halarchaeum acidiphilum MH1-52-1 TaxID=1261545 RepID=U3A4G7_9EURY|nr:pirin family protein [Halarchaeum acidiphilum]GAD52534.1 pirin-like protein YhhW, possibly qercetin 2,3-dioxygenase activity [Halarchaeum acidiphilum MH1-52-1]